MCLESRAEEVLQPGASTRTDMHHGEAGPLCLPLPIYLSGVRMLRISERGGDNPKLKTAAASAPDEVCLLERVAAALSSWCAAVTL